MSQPLLNIGDTLLDYRIVRLMGRREPGNLYEALDERKNRTVGIQLLPWSFLGEDRLIQRLWRELAPTNALTHRNICRISRVRHSGDRVFLVTEFVDGRPLDYVIGGEPLAFDVLVSYGLESAAALIAAHGVGMLHLGLNPSSIYVTSSGLKIMDFGLAAATDAAFPNHPDRVARAFLETSLGGSLLCTHLSIEQASGHAVDARSDIFSFGTVLYEMATGVPAFTSAIAGGLSGKAGEVAAERLLETAPVPPRVRNPGIPFALERIILKAMEKDRQLRYQSAADVMQDLASVIDVNELVHQMRYASAEQILLAQLEVHPEAHELEQPLREVQAQLSSHSTAVSGAEAKEGSLRWQQSSKQPDRLAQASSPTQPPKSSPVSSRAPITMPARARRRWLWASAIAAALLAAMAIPPLLRHDSAAKEAASASAVRGVTRETTPGVVTVAASGKNYALLFATDDYQHWPHLNNPLDDARTVADELQTNYTFSDTPPQVVANPKAKDVIDILHEYAARTYGPNDQLFIYFAGHGFFDEREKEGFLVMADSQSQKDDTDHSSYLDFSRLSSILDNIPVQHVFVVLDVCYGGAFDARVTKWADQRGDEYADVAPEKYIQRKLQIKGRLYLTSGQITTVPEGKAGQHSPFARRFIESLRSYGGKKQLVTATSIAVDVSKLEPEPRFGEFGDSAPGADFLFIPR